MKDLIKNITWNNVNATQEQIKGYVGKYAKDFNVYVANLAINSNMVTFTTYSKVSYEDLVVSLIRKQYPLNEELAILRKALNGNTTDYVVYNNYVETCKTQAKEFIERRNSVLEG